MISMRPSLPAYAARMIVERAMDPDYLSNTYLVAAAEGGEAFFVDAGGPVQPVSREPVPHDRPQCDRTGMPLRRELPAHRTRASKRSPPTRPGQCRPRNGEPESRAQRGSGHYQGQ